MNIKYIKHQNINKLQWDNTIMNATNGNVYAMSWFLDIVSPKWEALISDDYNIVMPLPVKSKLGLKYLVQPYYTQQLGVFMKHEIENTDFNMFIKKIPYRFYRLQFNSANSFDFPKEKLRPNYELELNNTYENIYSNFGQNCKRNINKAKKEKQTIKKDVSVYEFYVFLRKNSKLEQTKGAIPVFKELLRQSKKNGTAKILSVLDNSNNEIIASVFLLMWKNRIYYLMPCSSETGRNYKSMFLIIDYLIKKHSESNTVLDFEGSSIEGVAKFYKGFGAKRVMYPLVNKTIHFIK